MFNFEYEQDFFVKEDEIYFQLENNRYIVFKDKGSFLDSYEEQEALRIEEIQNDDLPKIKSEGNGDWFIVPENNEYWVELEDGKYGIWNNGDDIYKDKPIRIEEKN